jgi:hypothetical protein
MLMHGHDITWVYSNVHIHMPIYTNICNNYSGKCCTESSFCKNDFCICKKLAHFYLNHVHSSYLDIAGLGEARFFNRGLTAHAPGFHLSGRQCLLIALAILPGLFVPLEDVHPHTLLPALSFHTTAKW